MLATESVCTERILSNEYGDYLIHYNGDRRAVLDIFRDDCVFFFDDEFGVVYSSRIEMDLLRAIGTSYYVYPKCFGLMDDSNMEESGVISAQNQPSLQLRGEGTLIGIIDTGIDYQNPLFQNEDGTTRIAAIWDQTIQSGTKPEGFPYGSEYTSEMINKALQSGTPLEIVPSKDELGHGTFLSGIAAGNKDENNQFTGVAPDAELLVVKLKPAKEYLKKFYEIHTELPVFQESDILMAVSYLMSKQNELHKPVSICIGLGTNNGPHMGVSLLEQFLSTVARKPGFSVSIAGGNEGNARHHYAGVLTSSEDVQNVELNVADSEQGFTLEFWGNSINTFAIGIESPLGERVRRISPRFNKQERIQFVLEQTVVEIGYILIEEQSGNQLILLRFVNPTPGICNLFIYGTGQQRMPYHMWLPIRGFVRSDTFFVKSDPDITITEPSTSWEPITVAAYDHRNGSIYVESGRGYTKDNRIKPDLAAPGVEVFGPGLHNRFVTQSGTSVAAAHVAGAAALLFQWNARQPALADLNGVQIKQYLIRGANRKPGVMYPNRQWGYGTLDVFAIFRSFQTIE